MTDFDELFDKFQHSEQTVKSYREFINWVLGISIGICAITIFNIRDLNLCFCILIYYKVIIIMTMLNTLITGYAKYYIHMRDINMNTLYGSLKKLSTFSKINNTKQEVIKEKWTTITNQWAIEHNKITTIAKLLNISIITTVITFISVGLFIIVVI